MLKKLHLFSLIKKILLFSLVFTYGCQLASCMENAQIIELANHLNQQQNNVFNINTDEIMNFLNRFREESGFMMTPSQYTVIFNLAAQLEHQYQNNASGLYDVLNNLSLFNHGLTQGYISGGPNGIVYNFPPNNQFVSTLPPSDLLQNFITQWIQNHSVHILGITLNPQTEIFGEQISETNWSGNLRKISLVFQAILEFFPAHM